jgi:hypothetical protein
LSLSDGETQVIWNFKARYGGDVQGKVSFFILQDEPMVTLGVPKAEKKEAARIVAALNRHDRLVELLAETLPWLEFTKDKALDGDGAVRLVEEIETIMKEIDNAK